MISSGFTNAVRTGYMVDLLFLKEFKMNSKSLSNIYLFNPTCEYATANGNSSWQPNKLLTKMEEDMATLPLFFAKADDIVLVKQIPPAGYTESLRLIGINPPHFYLLNSLSDNTGPVTKTAGWLLPWGWSPSAHRILSPLKQYCSEDFLNSPVSQWSSENRELYSKKFAVEVQKVIISKLPREIMPSKYLEPAICSREDEIMSLVQKWGKLIIKAPWSTSGRGIQPITKLPVVRKVWEKINGMIKQQGYVIVEPLLDKKSDMALQFKISGGKITYLGISRFFTDRKGQYQGNFLNGWPDHSDRETAFFVDSLPSVLTGPVIETLEASGLGKLYEGHFGVDTLIFCMDNHRLKVNPCLEINFRYNMGLLSLTLEKFIKSDKQGTFRIFYEKSKSFYDFTKEMETRFPLKLKNKKIESGFFPLTPATEKSKFGAYMLVD